MTDGGGSGWQRRTHPGIDQGNAGSPFPQPHHHVTRRTVSPGVKYGTATNDWALVSVRRYMRLVSRNWGVRLTTDCHHTTEEIRGKRSSQYCIARQR